MAIFGVDHTGVNLMEAFLNGAATSDGSQEPATAPAMPETFETTSTARIKM